MKKLICAILTFGFMLALGGCKPDVKETDGSSSTIFDMIDIFRDAKENGGVIDTDAYYLETLQELICETKFRICGMVSDVNSEWDYFITAHLHVGEEKYYIYFTKDTKITNGEYVEVVGCIDAGEDGHRLLYNATVTERGSVIKDRLNK